MRMNDHIPSKFLLSGKIEEQFYSLDFRAQIWPLEQCFSTGGSHVLTFGSPKPVFYYYDSNIWVAKLCIILFYGSPTTKR